MSAIIGADLGAIDKTASRRTGSLANVESYDKGSQVWVYAKARTNIAQAGAVVVLNDGATSLTAASARNQHSAPIAIAGAKLNANEFGWFQIYGQSKLQVSGAITQGAQLTTSASSGAAGALTAAPTGGSANKLHGVFLMKASTAAGTIEDAFLSYPTIGDAI